MIIARTPFRVSFVGGGSDLPAFCERQTGAVLSVTIDKAMYLTLHPYFDRGKTLLRYSSSELVEARNDIQHNIFREAMVLMGVEGGVEISSTADIPSGTGLGSSSAFSVGLLHVLAAAGGRYASREYLASMASKLEIEILGEPIGRQDQYASAYGGLNLMEFGADGQVRVEPINIPARLKEKLESRLLMFYVGGQRATSSILRDQQRGLACEDEKYEATKKMVELVYEMRDVLYAGDLPAFGDLLHRNWEQKRSLSQSISNTLVDEAYERALEAGARGGKLCGAGGGGFLLFYCEPKNQAKLRSALGHLDEFLFRFSGPGSSIIYTDGGDLQACQGFFGRGKPAAPSRRSPGWQRLGEADDATGWKRAETLDGFRMQTATLAPDGEDSK